MKNQKGFTLVELLVAIVILGIIYGMAWPSIRRLQEANTYQKYENYGDILINAAKLYVDAYEEDLFIYDDDLERMAAGEIEGLTNAGQLMGDGKQCVFITYQDFVDHALIKDINLENITCNSAYTFVRVIRDKKNYSYKYYLGCGRRKGSAYSGDPIPKDYVDFTLPDRNNILFLEGNYAERCND